MKNLLLTICFLVLASWTAVMAQANSDTIAMIRDNSICDKSIVNDKKIPFRLSTKADKQLVGNKRVKANSDTEFKEYAYGTYTHGASENVYSEFYGKEIPNLFGRYAPSKSYGTVLYRSSENPNVYKISPWLNGKELFFEMDASGNISIQVSFTGFYGSSKGDDIFATDAFYYLGEHPSLYNKNGGVFDLYILFQSNGGVYGLDHDRFTITGYSGTCGKNTGDNVIWELNPETGELLIRGWGEMEDYVETSETGNVILQRPWEEYDISTIRVTEGVTNVGEGAFAFLTGVENVELSSSVETMSYAAFYGCSALTSLVLPNSLKAIGNYVFSDCSSLTSLVLPNSVETIGSSAFSGCSALTSLVLPNSVETIGSSAFYGCSGLTSLVLSNSVETIGDFAFSGCSSLTSLVIPNSVMEIGNAAFQNCSSLNRISVNANNPVYDSREGCNAIVERASNTLVVGCKETFIPNSVTSIGRGAFYGCSELTSLVVPNSVTNIDDYAMHSCSSLTNFVIPNSVKRIGKFAFNGCSSISQIVIPHSVVRMGTGVFIKCNSLKRISVDASNPVYDSREGCNAIVETASNTLLVGCKDSSIPNSVETIDDYAFSDCSGLTSLVLPNSVKTIGEFAFDGCLELESIEIGNSVETIGHAAFQNCSSLASLVLPNSVETIGDYAFYGCLELESIGIGNSVETVGQSAFSNCSSLASLVLPNSVETIGNYAFYGCSALTRLVLPNSITSIGRSVVYACSSLTDLVIPQSVTSIGDYAINRCSSLKSISIPNSVETIGYAAFYGCSELMSVEMGNSVTTIGDGGFGGCTKLESVKMFGEVPPTAFDNTFSNYDATLYVPVGASNTYRAADVWQNFSLIEEFETTGIEDINAIAGKDVTVYTTSGTLVLRVPNYNGEPLPLPTGIYVVRTGNASKKMVVK